MDYQNVLEMCGAKIYAMENFGSYQGDCYAKVLYEGKEGWIRYSFGSCSGCDELQSIISQNKCEEHSYDIDLNCNGCSETKEKLLSMGKQILDNILTYDEIMKIAKENEDWDMEVSEIVKFIEENK